MTARFHLVCEVCAEELLVADAVYLANSSLVQCPRCGSTDLILLDTGDDPGRGSAAAVAGAGGAGLTPARPWALEKL